MIRIIRSVVLAGAIIAAGLEPASAGIDTNWRNVMQIGCHKVNTVCWVVLDGASFGPAGCNGTEARFDLNDPNGRAMFTLIMFAKSIGKKVNLNIDSVCFAPQPAYPGFSWGTVEP